jgi:hypothetical protein
MLTACRGSAAVMAGYPSGGHKKPHKGITYDPSTSTYSLRVHLPAHVSTSSPGAATASAASASTCVVTSKDALKIARMHDCVQILFHGPFACTTSFPYSSYTQASLQSAADHLRQAGGCDVHAAITEMQRRQGTCAWARPIQPGATPGEWVAPMEWVVPGRHNKPGVIRFIIGPFPDPGAAARAADAALLVLEGPQESMHPCLNFPVASIAQQEVQAARDALVAWVASEPLFSGAYKQHEAKLLSTFERNIKAINTVSGPAWVSSVACLVGFCVYLCCCV